MNQETTTTEGQKETQGSLVVSFTKPTPMWATWVFRAVFLLTTAMSYWVAATKLVPESSKMEIVLGLKTLDVIIWGIGIDKKQFESTP